MFFHKYFSFIVLRMLRRIENGELSLKLPDGRLYTFGHLKSRNSIKADIQIFKWEVLMNLIRKGDIGFGEDYIHGKWDTNNLHALLQLAVRNRDVLSALVDGNRLFLLGKLVKHRTNENTVSKATENIKYHYDLGNEFYSIWLDESLTYSSAIFAKRAKNSKTSLLEAQQRKIDRALDLLAPNKKNGSVCEIGFGWGSMAERIYKTTQCHYHGITLSTKQYEYVQEKFSGINEGNRLKFDIKDYRLLDKKYDGIVSIEMFEAVGEKYWDEFFSTIHRCLNRNARAVIQTILIKDEKFEKYRNGVDFIQTYIFPGGMLPTKQIFKNLAKRHSLKIVDEFYFSNDYAETLKLWASKFEQSNDKLDVLGLSKEFKRMWKFYLNYCRSGFEAGDIDVGQYVLSKK